MRGPRIRTVLVAGALALVASIGLAWIELGRDRSGRAGLTENRFLAGLALGGFRAPLASFYWLKVDLDFRKGHYFDTARNLRTVASLNPHGRHRDGDSVWDYGAWHLAFNVSTRVDDPAEQAQYVLEGLDLARQGARQLPESANLLRTISAICLFRGPAYREAFVEAEGRHPEAVAYDAYRRLAGLDEVNWIDLALFAEAALAHAERLLIAGRFAAAQNVLGERVEKLDLARRLAEEGRAPAEESAQLRRERRTADKWYAAAKAAANGDFREAIRRLDAIRVGLMRDAGRELGEAELWVRRIEAVIRALEAR